MGDWPSASDLRQPIEDGLSARMLLSSIRRHLLLVVSFTLVLGAVGYLIALGQPTWYQAEGVMVIRAQSPRTAAIEELPDPSPDGAVIQSELDILKSKLVIEPVVRALELWDAPEYEYAQGWSWPIAKARLLFMWRDFWGIARVPAHIPHDHAGVSPQRQDSTPLTQAQIDGAVSTYAGYLTVTNDGHSNTIHVVYRALTPERAATIVNAHMDSYQDFGVETKVKAAERANSALTAQVARLRQQLLAAEAAVTRYREEHHLTGAAKDSGGVSGQITALNSQLISTRAEIAEIKLRAAGIGAGGENLPEVVNSGAVSALRGQEVQLTGREAALSKEHGDRYPELQQLRASLQNVRQQIARQIGRDRAAALQTVARAEAREQSLVQSITELSKQLNSADAGLDQLQSNAESVKSLLVSFEKRLAETAANPAFITPNATIASRANPTAAGSSASNTKKLALAGGFVGLSLGGLLSHLLELRDRGFRTSSQVQRHVGPLTVSATPRTFGRKLRSPADVILDDNRSALAEAFRVSWANVHLAATGAKSASAAGGRVGGTALGITSAASGEGKSTHALAFARTAALSGENVVLVDADLRRSGLSRLVNREFAFSLRDFLQEKCTANDVIALEERSGVHFVPSTPADISWTSNDLNRFSNFIAHLKNRFAIVIIDLPPVVGLADTIRLAMMTDSVALVIRWGRTERQFVQFALDTLRTASVSTIAVILNDIDLRALRRRGYRDHTVVYMDRGLYNTTPDYAGNGSLIPTVPRVTEPDSEPEASFTPPAGDQGRSATRPGSSMIEKLYDKYYG